MSKVIKITIVDEASIPKEFDPLTREELKRILFQFQRDAALVQDLKLTPCPNDIRGKNEKN